MHSNGRAFKTKSRGEAFTPAAALRLIQAGITDPGYNANYGMMRSANVSVW